MALIVCLGASLSSTVNAECFGEDEYMVCSDVETDADGDIHARSWDTDGNTYHLDTETRPYANGHVVESSDSEGNTYHLDTETRPYANGHVVESSDSEGNSYSIKSWSDSSGAHTEDSEGNVCTITPTGQMIGCGQ
ncbi:hypothetical protein [Pseudomonas edaphica]|nr:hypothetical protein [Pseudomonas edaphica]